MNDFKESGLNEEILKAIGELGYASPTPIQAQTIPSLLDSRQDIIALAQTGTGKTAGFGLPIVQKVDVKSKNVQALILSPTRELCLQIANDLKDYSKYVKGIQILAVYGGASIEPQIKSLKKGVQVVVGTPGRTLDLIRRKALKLQTVQWLVLDEADEMLNMGFKEDLDSILSTLPGDKQTLLFSATMPKDVRKIAQNYMENPAEISVGKKNEGAKTVEHQCFTVKASDKYLALKRLADVHPDVYGIVFCRTRREAKEIADKLIQDGYNADALHGDLSQAQRDQVMRKFRTKHLQLLVATDVAARGIDVNDLTHVINYSLPEDPEVYVHRSGRTGRAGKTGVSIAIVHSREARKLRDIEKVVGKKFEHKQIPGGKEICEKRLYSLIDKVENVDVDEDQIHSFLPSIYKKLEWLEREELIKRFVSVEFNSYLEYYKTAKDINVSLDKREKADRSRKGGRDTNFSRLFINLGKKHKLKATNLIGIINDNITQQNVEIGKIEVLNNFSFFEVDKNYEQEVVNSLNDTMFNNYSIRVEVSKPKKEDDFSEKGRGFFRKDKKRNRFRRN